jgi:predicted permease
MLSDLRYAYRTLRQNRGFALTAIISVGLAIGANSAIFSIADGLLLRPLPISRPSDVVSLRSQSPSGTLDPMSYPDFVDFRERNRSFESVVAYSLAEVGFAKDPQAPARLKVGFFATGNFFDVLGVKPQIGRTFRKEEDEAPGRDAVVVLSHDLWQQEFRGDPSVLGRTVRLNGVELSVIGVAPESFTGMDQYLRPAFYIPSMMAPRVVASRPNPLTERARRAFWVKARLKQDVSVQAAANEAAAIARSLEEIHPQTNRGFGATVRTEMQTRIDGNQIDAMIVAVTMGLVFLVLAIACANVANLMLSRGRTRAREIAVRLAIGASRARIVRQLMIESLVIALAGGGLGLLIADFAVAQVSRIEIPGDLPIRIVFQLDERVLFFTMFVSVAAAVLFGLVPAVQATRHDLVSVIKAGAAGHSKRMFFGRNALVVLQVAGALVLLAATTQLYRGLTNTLREYPGFDRDRRLAITFDPSFIGYSPAQAAQFYTTLIERSRSLPGVQSAALTDHIPLTTYIGSEAVIPEGFQFPQGQTSVDVYSTVVDRHYFETLEVPILAGRGFVAADGPASTPVAMVNESFARRYLGENPIGKRIRLDPTGPWIEVVGITVTGKHLTIFEPPSDLIYLPFTQVPRGRMTLIAQAGGEAAALAAAVQEIVRAIDPNMPVWNVRTLDDIFEQRSVTVANLMIGLVGAMSLMGLVMAIVGLYAVVAYQVGRRTREIGIRMAVGAARMEIMRMVLKHAAVMSVTGAAIGWFLSIIAAPAFSMGLDVPPLQPAALAVVAALLLLTTLLAATIPARRASRIHPMQALREEG